VKKKCDKCWGTGKALNHAKLGRKARRRREEVGSSLRAAARLLGVSESFLCLLESGKRSWTKALYERAME